MVETEEADVFVVGNRSKPLRWLLSIFIQPLKTLREVTAAEGIAWLLPMLLLTVLTLASVFIAGPLRQQAAMQRAGELPPNFEWMSPEQQQYQAAQESMNGPAMIYLFPSVGAVIGLLLGWVLLGAILHLALTLLGSRSTNNAIYNLVAWASLPFAVRLLVQIAGLLATRQLITSPGLSGSGKSTLLYLLGGLDRPTSRQVAVRNQDLSTMDGNALAFYRRRTLGFIFQQFNLVASMTALENVAFPMRFTGTGGRASAAGGHCTGAGKRSEHHPGGRADRQPGHDHWIPDHADAV